MATVRVREGRRVWKTVCLLFAWIGMLARAAETAPNIIVVLADDLGVGDVGCYGGKVPTPNLDAMAREGTRFTQFYVAAPICSPSRAGLITGQFPARWRITSYLQTQKGNRECEQADFLATNAPSLPRVLKAAGYATAHIGKWHLGGGRDVTNAPKFAAYGYDLGYGTYESPEPHPDITTTNWIWTPRDKVKRWERTRWMVDRTLEFLRAHPGQPCFVNLWLDDTHTPWIPSRDVQDDPARRRDTRTNLHAVLIEMDREIGRLLASLRRDGLASNTLVLFLADNGPLPPFNQERTAGLRGSKLSPTKVAFANRSSHGGPVACRPVASIPTASSTQSIFSRRFPNWPERKCRREFSLMVKISALRCLDKIALARHRSSGNTGATQIPLAIPASREIAARMSPCAMISGSCSLTRMVLERNFTMSSATPMKRATGPLSKLVLPSG